MHLNFGYFLHTTLSINGKKKSFHVQNCPCGTVGAYICYGLGPLGLLVHRNVDAEFDRKVFLVDCLLWKTLNIAKISITECAQAFSCTRNSKCNHSRKFNCDEVSKWRHSVGSSSLYPFQSRYDVGTGLRTIPRG